MRRIFSFSVFMTAVFSSATVNATGDVSSLYGNTLKITYTDGRSGDFFFDADQTFTSTAGLAGTWSYNGGQLCLDLGAGEPSCATFEAGRLAGETWQSTADGDAVTTYEIVSGR